MWRWPVRPLAQWVRWVHYKAVPVPQGLRSPAPVPMAPMAPVSLPSYSAPTQQVPEPIESATTLDPKIRTTAERLARVLVGDIELYFPQKVAQGRQQGNPWRNVEIERSEMLHPQ